MTPFTVILGLDSQAADGRDQEATNGAAPGFGPACLHELGARWRFSDRVRLLTARTDSPALGTDLASAQAMILLAEGDFGLAPGTLHVLQGRKVAQHLEPSVTASPARMALVGCQTGPAPQIAAQVDPGVEVALTILRAWGVCPQPGSTPSGANAAEMRQPETVG